MTIIATNIDLAKNISAVRSVNQGGSVLMRQPKLVRAKLGRGDGGVAAWRDRDGGLIGRALLEAAVPGAGPHRAAACAQAGHAVAHDWQAR